MTTEFEVHDEHERDPSCFTLDPVFDGTSRDVIEIATRA
jgi:hypothetical protein